MAKKKEGSDKGKKQTKGTSQGRTRGDTGISDKDKTQSKGASKRQGSADVLDDSPISQAAYARRCKPKISPQFVNKLVQADVILLDENGLVVPSIADKARASFQDPTRMHRRKENTPDNGKAGSVTEGDPDEFSDAKVLEALKDELSADDIRLLEIVFKKLPSYNGARRIGETVKASNELLEFQKARELLVDANGVEEFWAEQLSMVKAKLLTLPRSMAQKVASLALKYAAELGRDLVKAIVAIKKKKGGKWSYNKKTGAVELFAGKGKKPFVIMPLNPEAPEFAESMITNETEAALATEVHAALNELAGEKESD